MNHWEVAALALFLILAVICDLRWRRIPNLLIALMLAMGLAVISGADGSRDLLAGLAGLALGAGALSPFYAGGGMGAGDVKLMGAAGLFLGPGVTVVAVVYALIFGAFLAAAKWAARRRTAGGPATGRGIAYAPAIAAGVAAGLLHSL